jgi:hypothetical protein
MPINNPVINVIPIKTTQCSYLKIDDISKDNFSPIEKKKQHGTLLQQPLRNCGRFGRPGM